MGNAALKLIQDKSDVIERTIGASSGLFKSKWGIKYKSLRGKAFQVVPSSNVEDYLESPEFVWAGEVFKTETHYIIRDRAQKVPYGSFAIYVAPFLHKMDRESDEEPILFGHIVLHKDSILILNVDNIESPYRGGW